MTRRFSILLVDDNVDLIENLQELLEDNGADVEIAGSGAEALRQLEQRGFDLVITDMRMPRMSGLEVLREIRDRFPHVPVAIMTAYAADAMLANARAEGAVRTMSKPLDLDNVMRVVSELASSESSVVMMESNPDARSSLCEALFELGLMPRMTNGEKPDESKITVIRMHRRPEHLG